MHQYEIRIARTNGNPQIVRSRFMGDFHAVRRGEQLAGPDTVLEVWRDEQCIFRRETLPHGRMAA